MQVKELLKGPLKGNLEDEAKLARSLKVSSGLLAVNIFRTKKIYIIENSFKFETKQR